MSSENETKDEQKDINKPSSIPDSTSSSELPEKNEDYGKKIRDMLKERQQIQQQQQ